MRAPRHLAVGALVLACVAALILRDSPQTIAGDGFTIEVPDGVQRDDPRDGELLRLRSGRVTLAVRPLELPPYEGNVAGAIPVYVSNRTPAGATSEGRARINSAPGYQVTLPTGTDVYLVRGDRAREGVVLAFRRPPGASARAAKALRLALRSFEFGGGGD